MPFSPRGERARGGLPRYNRAIYEASGGTAGSRDSGRRAPAAGERNCLERSPSGRRKNDAVSELGGDRGRARHVARGGGATETGREASQPRPERGEPAPLPDTRAHRDPAGPVGRREG